MTFKSLEQRFRESSGQLYTRLSNPQALTPVIPDTVESRSRIKDDSRLLPVASTVRDVKFISKFITSNNGVLFIAKQLLLQTGNTFAETRLYNPTSPITNLVPSLHLVRHFGNPKLNLKTPTRDNRGALQKETVENNGSDLLGSLKNTLMSPIKALKSKPELTSNGQFYKRPEDGYTSGIPLFANQLLTNRGDKKTRQPKSSGLFGIDIGFYSNEYVNSKLIFDGTKLEKKIDPNINSKYIFNGIPESSEKYISKMTGPDRKKFSVFNVEKDNQKDAVLLNSNIIPTPVSTDNTESPRQYAPYGLTKQIYKYSNTSKTSVTTPTGTKDVPFKKLEAIAEGNGYFTGQNEYANGIASDQTTERTTPLLTGPDKKSVSSKIKDPFNLQTATSTNFYSSIAQDVNSFVDEQTATKNDIIKFIFSHPYNNSKIHFRAFINAFKETVKPEFAEQRYIGRTERFVTYSGAKRTATLSFNIVAFSKDEIGAVWKRVNYLTGLAFPRGVSSSGFMIPPLFRLTVGGIYDSQPVYIDTLEHEFIDENGSIVFDIDEEVSQVINVNMTVSLLEKESKFYDSPFYAIAGN